MLPLDSTLGQGKQHGRNEPSPGFGVRPIPSQAGFYGALLGQNQDTARPQRMIPARTGSLGLPKFMGWFVGSLNRPIPTGIPPGIPPSRASGSTPGFPGSAFPEGGPATPSWPHPQFPRPIHGQAPPASLQRESKLLEWQKFPGTIQGVFPSRIGVNPSSSCSAGALDFVNSPKIPRGGKAGVGGRTIKWNFIGMESMGFYGIKKGGKTPNQKKKKKGKKKPTAHKPTNFSRA